MGRMILAGFLSLWIVTTAWAGIGKIVAAKGDIGINRGGMLLKAAVGSELEEKDLIVSGENAKAQILFNDKTVITIGKNSRLDIKEYFFENGKQPKATFGIVQGAFRSITGQIGKIAPERFKLTTKTASLGIRGTQILGDIGENEKIACTEGSISVTTPRGEVIVEAGEITYIFPGEAPSTPRAYEQEEIGRMAHSAGGGGKTMKPNELIDTNGDPHNGRPPAGKGPDNGGPRVPPPGDSPNQPVPGSPPPPVEPPVGKPMPPLDPQDPQAGGTPPPLPEEFIGSKVVLPVGVENDYFSWGLWVQSGASATDYTAFDVVGTWIDGLITDPGVIEGYLGGTGSQSVTYTGGVAGTVRDNTAGTADLIQNGTVNLTFDFDSATVSGNIAFDAGDDHWDMMAETSSVTGGGFSIESFATGSGSSVSIGSGSAEGRFYGANAEGMGGNFNVDSADSAKTAAGIFTGTQ